MSKKEKRKKEMSTVQYFLANKAEIIQRKSAYCLALCSEKCASFFDHISAKGLKCAQKCDILF